MKRAHQEYWYKSYKQTFRHRIGITVMNWVIHLFVNQI
jgi:hypothetical protein